MTGHPSARWLAIGLASIDGAAHESALGAGAPTIGVLRGKHEHFFCEDPTGPRRTAHPPTATVPERNRFEYARRDYVAHRYHLQERAVKDLVFLGTYRQKSGPENFTFALSQRLKARRYRNILASNIL